MGGRAWSQEELIRLEELTETYPLATVARKLNRSENAVFLKRQRLGIGGFIANTDMLTRNTLSRILGVENRTIQYWERKGLKSVRKNPYVMYRQQDIIRYMKEHPEDWNAARVTDGIYEKTINGNYSIADIRNAIIEERQKKVAEKPVEEVIAPISQPQVRAEEPKEQIKPTLYDKLRVYLLEQLDIRLPERKKQASVIEKPKKPDTDRKWFKKEKRKENREKVDDTMLIHPSSEAAPEPVPRQIHPTVCLSDYREHPQGMLLYEGMENRSNIIIDKDCTRIGQGDEADAVIGKDTISHFHAVINRENQEFYLEDLNSTNGTFVNNEVLAYKQKKQLKSNDIIRFADVKYRFV